MVQVHRHQCLVIGGGLAGLRAAIELALRDIDVAILSKVYPDRSHSVEAEGGAAAELDRDEESLTTHYADTIRGGAYLCDQNTVRHFVDEAPNVIEEIESWGCIWDREPDGRIAQRFFGGMTRKRTCFHGADTGRVMLRALSDKARRHADRIHSYYEFFVTDLLVASGRCLGAIAVEYTTGQLHSFQAPAVIIATGGAGAVFRFTTNAARCSGDGMALAYRAGIALQNMEMVQFHPTCSPTGYLITEGVRGDGGFLFNKNRERFLEKYGHGPASDQVVPNRMEMVSRDKVSLAMYQEIMAGNGIVTPKGEFLLLDISHKPPEYITSRLGEIHENVHRFFGIDITKEPIPVRPGVHYIMGGIATDASTATSVTGIYAAGETACNGLHGANRLGSNSLTETLVFGKRAGDEAAGFLNCGNGMAPDPDAFASAAEEARESFQELLSKPARTAEGENAADLEQQLYAIMDTSAGVYRNGPDLDAGIAALADLKRKVSGLGPADKKLGPCNRNLLGVLELCCKLEVAEAVLCAAYAREESRGAHQRADHPDTDNAEWLKHSLVYRDPAGGGAKVERKDVVIVDMMPS